MLTFFLPRNIVAEPRADSDASTGAGAEAEAGAERGSASLATEISWRTFAAAQATRKVFHCTGRLNELWHFATEHHTQRNRLAGVPRPSSRDSLRTALTIDLNVANLVPAQGTEKFSAQGAAHFFIDGLAEFFVASTSESSTDGGEEEEEEEEAVAARDVTEVEEAKRTAVAVAEALCTRFGDGTKLTRDEFCTAFGTLAAEFFWSSF